MTRTYLHSLLTNAQQQGAEACLTDLGSALVTPEFVASDGFWSSPRELQMLYALCSILHHAGHNGFGVVWDYHHGDGTAMIAAAVEALHTIAGEPLHRAAYGYWSVLTEQAKTAGVFVPEAFSRGTREDFARLHDYILQQEPSVFRSRSRDLDRHAGEFVSCWDSDFPDLALKWLRSQEDVFAKVLCRDAKAEHGAGGERSSADAPERSSGGSFDVK